MLSWNARSVLPKMEFLREVVAGGGGGGEGCGILAVALCETWAVEGAGSSLAGGVALEGYMVIESNVREPKAGGVSLYSKMAVYRGEFLAARFPDRDVTSSSCQSVAAVCDLPGLGGRVIIVSVYVPPDVDMRLFLEHLSRALRGERRVVILGDFNAKHLSWDKQSDARGAMLSDWLDEAGLDVHSFLDSEFVTRPAVGGNGSNIDLVLSSLLISPFLDCGIVADSVLFSDHNPLSIKFPHQVQERPKMENRVKWSSFKEEDWDKFQIGVERKFVGSGLNRLFSELDEAVDGSSALDRINAGVVEVLMAVGKAVAGGGGGVGPRRARWLSFAEVDVRPLFLEMRRARSQYNRRRTVTNRARLKRVDRFLRRVIRTAIKKMEDDLFQSLQRSPSGLLRWEKVSRLGAVPRSPVALECIAIPEGFVRDPELLQQKELGLSYLAEQYRRVSCPSVRIPGAEARVCTAAEIAVSRVAPRAEVEKVMAAFLPGDPGFEARFGERAGGSLNSVFSLEELLFCVARLPKKFSCGADGIPFY